MAGPPYRLHRYGNVELSSLPELDGGGDLLWPDYVAVVRKLFGKVERAHEWCAGPGYIGFSLLGHGLCDELSLSDVNPRAVEAMRDTVRRNGLEGRVQVYESDVLDGVSADERWDLVVGNPPHHRVDTEDQYRANILGHDPDWRLHRKFYATVAQHLKPSGSALILENYDGSCEADFATMLDGRGLELVGSFMYRRDAETPAFGGLGRFYYYWTRRKPQEGCDSQILWHDGTPAEKVSLRIAGLGQAPEHIEVKAARRYAIEIRNELPTPLHLGLIAEQRYVWPFPLPLTVDVDARAATGTLTFEPGEYRLVHVEARNHGRDRLWRRSPPVEHVTLATIRAAA